MESKTVLTVLLALTVAVSGCLNSVEGIDRSIEPEVEDIETELTGNQLLESSTENFLEQEKYSIESDNQLLLSTTIFDLDISSVSKGDVDRAERTVKVNTIGAVSVSLLSMSNSTSFETYAVTNETSTVVENSTGDRKSFDTGFDQNPFTSLKVLEDADAELLGSENLNSTETYVVSVDAEPEKLGEHFSEKLGLYMDDPGSEDETEEVGEDVLRNVEAYLWIDQETERPVKLGYIVSMDVEDEDEGFIPMSGLADIYSVTEFRY